MSVFVSQLFLGLEQIDFPRSEQFIQPRASSARVGSRNSNDSGSSSDSVAVQSAENVDILGKVAIPFDAQIGYQCPGDCAFTDSSRSIASVT
jgi:hypothetical protein